MKSSYFSIAGFLLLAIGILSIVLSLVGLKLNFLGFLYEVGAGFALLIQIIMMVVGVVMMYYAKMANKME